jgi:dihydroxyacetone kinase-like protein
MSPSTTPLDGDDFTAMATATSATIDVNAGILSSLDALSGDGDHGANVQRAMTRARIVVDELPTPAPAAVLGALAAACAETMAGAAGAVFAAFFGGAAAAIGDEPIVDADALSGMFAAGLQRVQRVGGAAVGDKSIVDALAPAVDAAESMSARTADVVAVLSSAATAARAGAEATNGMSARVGRARYAESGGRGSPDPGAVTIALVLESWVDAIGGRRRIDQGVEQPRSVDASPESTDRSLSGRQ